MLRVHTEIEHLKNELLELGALIEERVALAVKSISSRDRRLAQKVIDGDTEIDQLEVELEENCLKTLALHQPVAVDLRVIIAVLKINSDLERVGDFAVDIAERGVYFATHAEVTHPFDFLDMANKAQQMLRKSLDALVNLDITLAKEVCAADDAVDDIHRNMFQLVEKAIKIHPHHTEQYLNYLSVSRYLERIADHATNIAEDAIYIVEGYVVRHRVAKS